MAAKKGGIVVGYARGWPREIFDNGGELAKLNEFLNQPGVYVLYNDGEPHYIGQAISMGKRLMDHAHPRSRYYHLWNTFSAFQIGKPKRGDKLRDELEAILIAAMPTANAAKPRLTKMRLPRDVTALMKRIRDAKIPD